MSSSCLYFRTLPLQYQNPSALIHYLVKSALNLCFKANISIRHHSLRRKLLRIPRHNPLSTRLSRILPASKRNRLSKVTFDSVMAFNSPPPSDDCPELTPDNGTPTSSSAGSVSWNQAIRHWAEEVGNSQQTNNALYIFNNDNHQASPSALSTFHEHDGAPASTSEAGCPGSTHPESIVHPEPLLHDPMPIPVDLISPIDIGSPLVPLESSLPPWSPPRSHRAIRFETEPTAIHSSPPSSSRRPTITPQSGRGQQGRGLHGGLRRLRSRLPNLSSWFGRVPREDRGEAQPRRWLSLRWFGRRRNGGS